MKKEAIKKFVVYYDDNGKEKKATFDEKSEIDWDAVSKVLAGCFTVNSNRGGHDSVQTHSEKNEI